MSHGPAPVTRRQCGCRLQLPRSSTRCGGRARRRREGSSLRHRAAAFLLLAALGMAGPRTSYRTILDSAHVFAAVLFVLALTLVFDGLMRQLEWRLSALAVGRRQAASAGCVRRRARLADRASRCRCARTGERGRGRTTSSQTSRWQDLVPAPASELVAGCGVTGDLDHHRSAALPK